MILGNKFFHFVVFLAYISKIIRSTYYIENLELFNDNNHIFEFCSSENHAGIGKLIQSIVSNNNDIEFNLKTTCHKNINVFTNFPNCYSVATHDLSLILLGVITSSFAGVRVFIWDLSHPIVNDIR